MSLVETAGAAGLGLLKQVARSQGPKFAEAASGALAKALGGQGFQSLLDKLGKLADRGGTAVNGNTPAPVALTESVQGKAMAAFTHIDANRDGQLSQDELKNASENLQKAIDGLTGQSSLGLADQVKLDALQAAKRHTTRLLENYQAVAGVDGNAAGISRADILGHIRQNADAWA